MTTTSLDAHADAAPPDDYLSWFGVIRIGLVQTALGAVVVLTTSTLNRVMVVELGLLAMLPGALVAIHYAIQMLRPAWGHGSDKGGRRTPWIVGGMGVLALGGALAALSTVWMASAFWPGLALAVFAFVLIGVGVGAAGTSALALLAAKVAPGRHAAAASIVWIMMILGLAATAGIAGALLKPYSPARLIEVASGVCLFAFLLAAIAVTGLEGRPRSARPAAKKDAGSLGQALREAWSNRDARRFTIFVFVSMLAYSAQDLILEPFAGLVFDYSPGESTQLGGLQHAGALAGMIVVAVLGSVKRLGGRSGATLRFYTIAGCLASGGALFALAGSGVLHAPGLLQPAVFALGFFNGGFAVAAIGSMMALARAGGTGREGLRLGLWGAAQAIAFGLGGFLGASLVDGAGLLFGDPAIAYPLVFGLEGGAFLIAAYLAARVQAPDGETAAVSVVAELTPELTPEPKGAAA